MDSIGWCRFIILNLTSHYCRSDITLVVWKITSELVRLCLNVSDSAAQVVLNWSLSIWVRVECTWGVKIGFTTPESGRSSDLGNFHVENWQILQSTLPKAKLVQVVLSGILLVSCCYMVNTMNMVMCPRVIHRYCQIHVILSTLLYRIRTLFLSLFGPICGMKARTQWYD